MVADADDADSKIRALEKGQMDLRESVHGIRNSLQILSRDSEGLAKKFDRFLEDQTARDEARQRESRAKTLTPEKLVQIVVTALGGVSILLGGGVWMINQFTSPVQGNVMQLAGATAERINSLSTQLNGRLDTFQESIRSIREGDARVTSAIADIRVSQGRQDDRIGGLEKRWETWDRHDWPGVNATQSAEIAINRRDIELIKRAREHEQDRLTDAAAASKRC